MRTPDEKKKELEYKINMRRLRDEKAWDEHMPGSLLLKGRVETAKWAYDYITQLEQRLASVGKTCPEWISVKDRKPEGVVLVANFAPGTDGYKKMDVADAFDAGNSDITFYLLNGFDVEYDVTHWMPIPTPPPKKG